MVDNHLNGIMGVLFRRFFVISGIMAQIFIRLRNNDPKMHQNLRNYGYQFFGQNGTSPSENRSRYPPPPETVNHPSFDINGSDAWSKALFVTTRAARFCSFCNFLRVVSPAQPQTEQQYLKCESTMLNYILCMVCSERYLLEYLSIPIPLEILPTATSICSFQFNDGSI